MTNHRTLRAASVAAIVGGIIAAAGPLAALASADPGTAPTEQPAAQRNRGRIQFAPGTSSGTVNGAVARGDWDHWAVNGRGGQTFEVAIAGNATFELYSPSGSQMANDVTSFSGTLPADGDYAVDVGSTGGIANYTLTVTITGEPTPQQPPRDGHFRGQIQFAPGTDSDSVSGVVPRGDWDEWSFRAGAGQTVNLSVAAAAGNATFSLYAPNGQPLAAHTTSFTGTLPAAGLYMIEVGSTGGVAEYTAHLQITGDPAPPQPPRDGHFRGQIQFEPGTDSGSVSGVVARGDWDEWSFRAAGGQTLDLAIYATDSNATFSIYAPDGRPLAAHTTLFSGTLPADGLYMIEVGSTGGTASYELYLSIT